MRDDFYSVYNYIVLSGGLDDKNIEPNRSVRFYALL